MLKKLSRAAVRSKAFQASVVSGGALVAASAARAQATLPTGVDAAIGDAGDMLVLGATTVIIAMVAFWGVRTLGKKMGWWA